MTSTVFRIRRILFLLLLTGATGILAAQTVSFPTGEFPGNLTYNNFYAVTVQTDGGESFTLFDAAYFAGETPPWPDATGSYGDYPGAGPKDMNYFLWVRRMGDRGAVTYPLAFNRIKEIRFMGPYGGIVGDDPSAGTLFTETTGDTEERPVTFREDGRRFSGWFFPAELEPGVPSYTPAILVLTNDEEQTVYVKTDGFLGGIDEKFGTYAMLWLRHDGVKRLVFHHDGSYARCDTCGAIFFDNRENPENPGEPRVCPFDGTPLDPQQ